MGDRAMAEIKTEGGSIYFYTHWSGHRLPEAAREAVEIAKPRIGDHAYSTRIVIDQLIKLTGARDSETGAGIMLKPYAEDEYNGDSPSVIIDMHDGSVTTRGRH